MQVITERMMTYLRSTSDEHIKRDIVRKVRRGTGKAKVGSGKHGAEGLGEAGGEGTGQRGLGRHGAREDASNEHLMRDVVRKMRREAGRVGRHGAEGRKRDRRAKQRGWAAMGLGQAWNGGEGGSGSTSSRAWGRAWAGMGWVAGEHLGWHKTGCGAKVGCPGRGKMTGRRAEASAYR